MYVWSRKKGGTLFLYMVKTAEYNTNLRDVDKQKNGAKIVLSSEPAT